MSISIYVRGFKPADTQWDKMKAVWDSCIEAGVEVPDSVAKFFDYEDPEDKPGMEVELGEECCLPYKGEYESGYEIDISSLPDGVKYIRALMGN